MQASVSAGMWLDDEWQAALTRRLRRAVVISIALHVGLMFLIAWSRVPRHVEEPLASIEISLASLPSSSVKVLESQKEPPKNSPAQKTAEPPKAVEPPKPIPPPPKVAEQPKAVEQPKAIEHTRVFEQPKAVEPPKVVEQHKAVEQPKVVEQPKPLPPAPVVAATPPPVKAAPAPAPPKPSNDVMREMLKDIELPPDAPKYGDISPVEKSAEKLKKTQLKLPDVPVVTDARESKEKLVDAKPASSLTEDVSKELDEELKRIKKVELPKPVVSAPAEAPSKAAPQVEAKVPSMKAVDTTLKVPGIAPGSNAYLALVRHRISSFWSAPPVDSTGRAYVVIVQFRLHRTGAVTGVTIEQSSGNEYYDLAGKRAVLSATPLPVFPAEITDAYFDAHFTFTVGESRG